MGLFSHVVGLSIHVQGLGLRVAWRSALVIAIITMVLRTDLACNLNSQSLFICVRKEEARDPIFSSTGPIRSVSVSYQLPWTGLRRPRRCVHELRG